MTKNKEKVQRKKEKVSQKPKPGIKEKVDSFI